MELRTNGENEQMALDGTLPYTITEDDTSEVQRMVDTTASRSEYVAMVMVFGSTFGRYEMWHTMGENEKATKQLRKAARMQAAIRQVAAAHPEWKFR